MSRSDSPKPIKGRDRVIATRRLGMVAEGTAGTVKVVNGLAWARYWVRFDNGSWMGSVSGADLVRENDWEDFQRRRAEEAARPAPTEAVPVAMAAEGPGAEPAVGGAQSRVPAHLLERSRMARERRAAG